MIVIALALCVAAIVVYQAQNKPTTKEVDEGKAIGGALLADLTDAVEDIDRIEITNKEESLILTRTDDNEWLVETYDGYPADHAKINRLIVELTGIKVADRLTDKPEKYEQFGLEGDVGSAGRVRMLDEQGDVIMTLLIGKERETEISRTSMTRPGGRYLRINNEPYVYLADADVYWINTNFSSWTDTQILSVPANEVVSVGIDHGSTQTFTVEWKDNKPVMDHVEEGMKEKPSELSAIRGALSGLYITGALSEGSDKAHAIEFDATYTARVKDGTIYNVKAGTDGEKYFVKLDASYGEPLITEEDEATTETLAAVMQKAEEAEKAVPEINQKHQKWVYEISKGNYDRLTKRRSDMIEPVEPPQEEES